MLKKPASFVLASLRPFNVPQGHASGSSLAAALLDGLFEHPGAQLVKCGDGKKRQATAFVIVEKSKPIGFGVVDSHTLHP
jgi:hypothetical protein